MKGITGGVRVCDWGVVRDECSKKGLFEESGIDLDFF